MRVSVIIPSHNAERYLGQAIGSALDQTLPPVEVIVVDDASSDGSLEVARRFEARFPNVVRVYAEQCRNAPRVRNYGASIASGDALMFLDSDDVLAPDSLEALAGALEGVCGAVAICPWYHLRLHGGRWRRAPRTCRSRRPGQDPVSAYLEGWAHPPVSVLWSREAFDASGGWDERCRQNQDGDVMMRAFLFGASLVETEFGAGYYRRHPSGPETETITSRRYTYDGVRNLIYVTRKIAWLSEHQGDLRYHRPAVRRSFALIAGIAEDHGHHDLVRQARAGVAKYQQPWETLVSWNGRSPLRRVYRSLHGRLKGPEAPTDDEAYEEISHGMRVAEMAASASSSSLPAARRVPRPETTLVVVSAHTEALGFALGRLTYLFGSDRDDVEVVVVDMREGEDSSGIVNQFGDDRVRYVGRPRRDGRNAARNLGLRRSRGDVVALLDAEEPFEPEGIECQVSRFGESGDDLGLVAVRCSDTAAPRRQWPGPYLCRRTSGAPSANVVVPPLSCLMIRRLVVASVGYLDEQDGDDLSGFRSRVSRFFEVDEVLTPIPATHADG